MTRIAVGGFLHETNTFAPTKATYADFVHGGGWPSMAHGADVLKVMRKINVGLAGFVERYNARDMLRGRGINTTQADLPQGVAQGISPSGALLVQTGQALRELSSGEVSVRLQGDPLPAERSSQPC